MCIEEGRNVAGIEESDKCFESFMNPGIVNFVSFSSPGLNCK
jgi:hypothetical protein